MLNSGSYTVRLVDDAGLTDPNPRLNRITVIPDRPPTVELLKPGRQSSAAPGTEVHVDDPRRRRPRPRPAAIGDEDRTSRLRGRKSRQSSKQWTDFGGDSTAAVRQYRLRLDPATVKPGQTVSLRAVAWDKRAVSDWGLELGPQQGESEWHAVKIVAADAEQAAALEQLESLRGAIWKLLEKQLAARTAAAPLVAAKPQAVVAPDQAADAKPQAAAADVRTRQIEIQKNTVELVNSIGPTDRPGAADGQTGTRARWPSARCSRRLPAAMNW